MAEILKMQDHGIKEIIERDILGGIRNVLNIELFSFASERDPVVLTVGLLMALIVSLLAAQTILKGFCTLIARKMTAEGRLKFVSVFGFIQYFIYIIMLLLVLSAAGINTVIFLLTVSATLFVGLVLALREIFSDVIGGIFLQVVKSLNVGDVDEIENREGGTIRVNLRTIRVLTRDDTKVIIPDHTFLNHVVRIKMEEIFGLHNIQFLSQPDIHHYDSQNLKPKKNE